MRPTRSQFLRQVQVNLNRYLERNRGESAASIAGRTGYAEQTIHKFRAGTILTMPVAVALIVSIPELGRDLSCPCCGATLHPATTG